MDRTYKLKTKKAITDNIDVNNISIDDLEIKELYKLADRAERIVKRIKLKKEDNNGTQQ